MRRLAALSIAGLVLAGCAARYQPPPVEDAATLQQRATQRYMTVKPGPWAKPQDYVAPSQDDGHRYRRAFRAHVG